MINDLIENNFRNLDDFIKFFFSMLCGVIIIFFIWLEWNDTNKLRIQGKITRGIVYKETVALDECGSGRRYKFTVNSKLYEGAEERCNTNSNIRTNVGDSVTIVYLPQDPNVNGLVSNKLNGYENTK